MDGLKLMDLAIDTHEKSDYNASKSRNYMDLYRCENRYLHTKPPTLLCLHV